MAADGLNFTRTRDWALIKKIVTESHNFRQIADDGAPQPENWAPIKNDAVWYVLIKDAKNTLGVWAFFPETSIAWRAHICFLPIAYGRTLRATKELFQWIWANTPCQRIVGAIPRSNRLALKLVHNAGCQAFGIDRKSFLKNGVLEDRVFLGISRA